ncbi:TonB-dependent receptor domain-containing protein [Novosphingobium fluoreni]|uniref:TonB-dependent receptor domain-containing protein n=1 Tax=Novosphingobium fluoreni TaxID=1391222 RepID=UPI003DA1084F
MTTSFKKAALLSATCLGAFVGLASSPVQAQDAPTSTPAGTAADAAPADAIVVTGSRIARRNLETAAPVAVVSSEEFKLSGAVNVEQVINTLPQVIPGVNSFSNNPGGGVSTLNLRGLGDKRTLVLVNNRRWMFYDTSQVVDVNTIPSFLIDNVEIVTGGASAVYGSDAVSGVVNFRLKNVQGVEAGAQYNLTQRGDGRRYEAYVALGSEFAEGRGHATVFAEYYKRASIGQGARKFSRNILTDDGAGGYEFGGSSTTPNGRFTSTYAAADCPTGNIFCGGGAYFTAPGVSRPRTGADVYNYAPDNYLMVPQERYLLGGYGDYEIGNGHTAYVEATFTNNRVKNLLASTPVTGTFQVDINSVSPFISAANAASLRQLDAIAGNGNRVVGDGIVPIAVQRRINESGGRLQEDERNSFRALIGMKGPITDRFNYDVYYMYARTRNSQVQDGNISRSAFQAGLNGVGTPINIFGPGTLSPAALNAITIRSQNGDVSALQVASASVSGSLFNLGWGGDDVGIAIGGEYRKVSSRFIPDTALSSGDVIGFNAGQPTDGSYNVKEAFAELRVPIAADRPGISRLEVTGAVRYSDYSLDAVGGVWTYSGAAEYAPVRDITFRGQYQRAIRAPNVAELFGGQFVNFPTAVDPCAVASAAGNATVRNLCIATGVPAAAVGTAGLQINTQIQGNFGGNPNLQQETSDSYTAGVVVRPSFIPGLSFTADWFKIKIDGAIDALGGGLANSLSLCYNVIQNINSPYCQAFVGTRNALGQFDGEVNPQVLNANTGGLKSEGVDFELNYVRPLNFGLAGESSKISFNTVATYTYKQIITPVQDLSDQFTNCAGKFGALVCGNPIPKWKWTSRLSWIDGPVTTSFRWRHLSSVRDDDPSTDYTAERLKAYNVFDLSFSVDATESFNLSFGVNNLLDKKPLLSGDNQEQANTYPGTYDVLGRDFFISGRVKF